MFSVQIIDSIQSFREIASEWDDLWRQSQTHVALHQAEPLCQFAEAFGWQAGFRAVLVRFGDQIVTGVPLIVQRGALGGWRATSLANEWAVQACFLDSNVGEMPDRVRMLNEGFLKLKLATVKMDWLPLDWDTPNALVKQWQLQNRVVWAKPRFRVHKMTVPSNWAHYYQTVSKNTRKTIQRAENQLPQFGPLQVEELPADSILQFERDLQSAYEIEHAGWKGEKGSSILSFPNIARYVTNVFVALAKQGLARLYFLRVGDQRIAFDLGYLVNGVYSSIKVSFLPDFGKYSPGHVLNARLLQQFSQSGNVHWIDCIGPATDSTARWTDESYVSGRLTLSTGSIVSNAQVSLLNQAATWLNKNSIPS